MPPANPPPPLARAPLHLCALTLNPHKSPVVSPDGTVFEGNTIRQLVRRTRLNPITGQPLSPDSLLSISFSTDPRTRLPRCPILFHSFHQNIKIAAIATSGNVYSYAAIQRLNIQQRNMTDLIDRTPFTMDDIIVLFDPQHHVWSTHPLDSTPVEHSSRPLQLTQQSPSPIPLRHPLASFESNPYRFRHPDNTSRPLPSTLHPHSPHAHSPQPSRIPPILPGPPALSSKDTLQSPEIRPKLDSLPPCQSHHPPPLHHSTPPQPIHSSQLSMCFHQPSIHPSAFPPTPSPYPSIAPAQHMNPKRSIEKRGEPAKIPKKPRLHPSILPAPRKPPTRLPPELEYPATDYLRRKKAEEDRKTVYKRIRKGRKGKGYVRVVTNVGHLNIELHCDKVPLTCDNFLSLAQAKYYDGLRWHKVIPGLLAQTGDPSNTGQGGDSVWGGYFKDEFRTSLLHDSAGVVSMANSGRDTNLSQWFICLDAAPHLDGSHTVFGKVVGGLFVLKKIEDEAEMGHPLTVETIEVLVNPIRQVREHMAKAAMTEEKAITESSATTTSPHASPGNQQRPRPDQSRDVVIVSESAGTRVAPIHPGPQLHPSYATPGNHQQVPQEQLPSAKTLLTAANLSHENT